MAATAFAMLAMLLPLLSILSSAVVALVTLRKGAVDGLVVGAISAVAGGVLAFLTLGTPTPVVGFMLTLWLPVWALGLLLRSSRSLTLAVQAALGFGLVLILLLYVQMGEPALQWEQLLQPVADGFVESQVMDAAQSRAFIALISAWMTGIVAAGFYFQLLLALLLARAWQAQMFNPGGFREEFHQLRVSRWLGLAAVPLLAVVLLQGTAAPGLLRDVGLLVAPLFFLQGLAVVHNAIARFRMNRGWLIAVYVLLFVAMPHAEILLALSGLADVFGDFRSRWKNGTEQTP